MIFSKSGLLTARYMSGILFWIEGLLESLNEIRLIFSQIHSIKICVVRIVHKGSFLFINFLFVPINQTEAITALISNHDWSSSLRMFPFFSHSALSLCTIKHNFNLFLIHSVKPCLKTLVSFTTKLISSCFLRCRLSCNFGLLLYLSFLFALDIDVIHYSQP